MRHVTAAMLLVLATLAPVDADPMRAGPGSLSGVLKWVPSAAQAGQEDLALVAGDQTIRFWNGGKLEGAELEKNVGKSVTLDGTMHEHAGAWFIAPDKLAAAAASDTTTAAPRAPVASTPQRASDLASQWYLDQHKGSKMEPVVRVKGIEGSLADVVVTGQSEDGGFSAAVKLSVDMASGTCSVKD